MATGKSCSRWFAPLAALLMVVSLSGCFDKEAMHSLDGRRRNIKTFDIDLATSKHSRNLVQQTGDIF